MNSSNHTPDFVPPAKPSLDRPGRHELLTLVALFISGCCAILTTVTGFAGIGAILLMAVGLAGLWRSRSWSNDTKAFATAFLLLLYVALAVMAVIAIVIGVGPPAAGVLLRLAVLGVVFGVPAGIGAWLALVFKTVRARVEMRPDDQDLAAA